MLSHKPLAALSTALEEMLSAEACGPSEESHLLAKKGPPTAHPITLASTSPLGPGLGSGQLLEIPNRSRSSGEKQKLRMMSPIRDELPSRGVVTMAKFSLFPSCFSPLTFLSTLSATDTIAGRWGPSWCSTSPSIRRTMWWSAG